LFESVRDNPSAEDLPDDPDPENRAGELKWASGALDGVLGHHSGSSRTGDTANTVGQALRGLLNRASDTNLFQLNHAVTREPVLSYLDAFLSQLSSDPLIEDRSRLAAIGRYFVIHSAQREATKFGAALLGVTGSESDVEAIATIGGHDEFTLYSAAAMENLLANPARHLWSLAKRVNGWGRIQAVERLAATTDPEIRAWLLRDGFRNDIMDEYLACICARAGRLHEALQTPVIDTALPNGAADILRVLINGSGGPAEDIDDYEHAPQAAESYLNHIWIREESDGRHFLAVKALRDFMRRPDAWETREPKGWNPVLRKNLTAACEQILSHPRRT
jgi:hypothetical protein